MFEVRAGGVLPDAELVAEDAPGLPEQTSAICSINALASETSANNAQKMACSGRGSWTAGAASVSSFAACSA